MKLKIAFINILLALIMIIMIPVSAYATENNEEYSFGHFYYHSHDGYVSVCGYLGRETEIDIPSSIAGKPVSEIESGTFDGCNSVKTITVPDTVVLAYDDSFTGASALEKIRTYTVGVEIKAGSGITIEYLNDTNDQTPAIEDEASKDDAKDTGSSKEGDNSKNNSTEDKKEINESSGNVGDYVFEEDDSINSETVGTRINDSDVVVYVDKNNHLVQTDSKGNVVVLDDSKEYKMEMQEDGNYIILDEDGNAIEVTEDGNVYYGDVKVDTRTSKQGEAEGDRENSFVKYALIIAGIAIIVVIVVIAVKNKNYKRRPKKRKVRGRRKPKKQKDTL